MSARIVDGVDTVHAFLSALGAGERAGLCAFLADDVRYRPAPPMPVVTGVDDVCRMLSTLYAGTGTLVEVVAVEERDGVVVSERRDRLGPHTVLVVRAVARTSDGVISEWTEHDVDSPLRLGGLLGHRAVDTAPEPARHAVRGR